MLITYKVLDIPRQVDENHWDIPLTDLNSNGAFKIVVRLSFLYGNLASGLVIDGPVTYKDKILTVAILAGYSFPEEDNEFVDASGVRLIRHKTISELIKNDRLIDIAEPS